MTNREWLESLSDEDFALWCTTNDGWDPEEYRIPQPAPRLNTIKSMYSSSFGGLLVWLKEERWELKRVEYKE